MAHKGVKPRNLFINGAPSPDHRDSPGRVIHQRQGPDTEKIDALPPLPPLRPKC